MSCWPSRTHQNMATMADSVNPGDPFDQLTAREPIAGGKFWLCDCKCGKTTKASKWHLLNNRRHSCGCRKKTPPNTHRCLVCEQVKPRIEFYLRKNTGRLHHKVCQECHKNKIKLKVRKLRLAALQHYSNGQPQCKCCGESNIEFLHLDHIGGWGKEHRKEIGRKSSIWRWLYKHDYPDLPFQVLCANCNLSLSAYGYCPHKQPCEPHPSPSEVS